MRRLIAVGAILVLAGAGRILAASDWNDSKIAWMPYEKGLAAAKAQKKPVCLIFYTEWCPHCRNYSQVFKDARVVEKSRRFVMIRVDGDKEKALSERNAPDGQYIPRTFFLTKNGQVDSSIHAQREQFKYFYDEGAPDSLLAGMAEALRKLG